MEALNVTTVLLDNLPFYAYLKDVNGKYLYANQKCGELFPHEQFIGKTDFEIFPFETAQKFAYNDSIVIKSKEEQTQFEAIMVDGTFKYVETFKKPIFDHENNVIAICGYTKDITAQKNENERAGTIMQMLASLDINNFSSLTLFDYDLLNDKMLWNSKFYEFYQIHPDSFNGTLYALFQFIYEEDRNLLIQKYLDALGNSQCNVMQLEFRIVTKENQLKYVWSKTQIHRDNLGKAIRLTAVHLDVTHTKKAEESFKKINDRLSIATKAGKIGLWSLDLSNMIFDWDLRMFELYGIEEEYPNPISFENWTHMIHKDDIERVKEQFQNDAEDIHLILFTVNFRIVFKNNETRYLLAQGKIDRTSKGLAKRFTGVTIDVTVTKLNELQTQKLNLVNQIATIGNWNLDLKTRHLEWDNRMFEIYGIDPVDFTYHDSEWISSLNPENKTKVLKELKSYIKNINIKYFTMEFDIIRRKDKKHLFIQNYIEVQRDKNGQAFFISGINLDITERKSQEQLIYSNERLLKTLTKTSPVGIFRINIDGLITFVTGDWEKITYVPIENSLNRLWYADIFIDSQSEENIIELWQKFQKNQDFFSLECQFKQIKQCRFHQCEVCTHWALIQLVPEYSEQNQLLGYTGTITNITERKKSEHEVIILNQSLERRIESEVAKNMQQERILLQQAKLASMGEMIGNIAHQWRQPLTALGLLIANLKDSYDYGEFSEEELNHAVQQAHFLTTKMSDTIDDFRNFFRPNKEKTVFSLQKQFKDVVFLLEASLKNSQITLKYNYIQIDDILLWGYPNEYSQAILNILSNAKDILVERKVKNPEIEIKIYTEKNLGHLEIIDNGGGIDPNIFPKIFDPYFTTKDSGTGIGLYMTKLIIEQNMNGFIDIYSKDDKTYVTISNVLHQIKNNKIDI